MMSLSSSQFELLHKIGVDGDGEAVCRVPFDDDLIELISRELITAYADDELAYLQVTDSGWRQLAS